MGFKSKARFNEYHRLNHQRRHAERKAQAHEFLGNQCVMCGELENLQLDHIDPETKLFTIGKRWMCAEEKFWAEVQKCQLLCVPCHKVKTESDFLHGGGLSGKRNCKCDPCRLKKNEYMRAYKARQRGMAK